MLKVLWQRLMRFRDDEHGATMVEYGLMLALIALVCIAALALVGQGTFNMFTANGNAIVNAL